MKENIISANLPIGGRIGRMAKILLQRTDKKTAEKVMHGYKTFESTKNYQEKAALIRLMMDQLEKTCDHDLCLEIMEACGSKCCGISTRQQAIRLMDESQSILEFLKKMNKKGIGGGRLILKDDHTITGGYNKCYCGQVKQTEVPFPTKTYCQCSVGWYKQLFTAAFGKEVKVELIRSIITGAESCEFVIHL